MVRFCSYNKVMKKRGHPSALMDGTPVIIIDAILEPNYDASVYFGGRIDVWVEWDESRRIVFFTEVAEDFSPGLLGRLNPLDLIARSDAL